MYSEILLSCPSIVLWPARATVLLGFKYPLCQYRPLMTLKIHWLSVLLAWCSTVLCSNMYSSVYYDFLCLQWCISQWNAQIMIWWKCYTFSHRLWLDNVGTRLLAIVSFLQWYNWGFCSSGTWCCGSGQLNLSILRQCRILIF
jgi:hypothetical protein